MQLYQIVFIRQHNSYTKLATYKIKNENTTSNYSEQLTGAVL